MINVEYDVDPLANARVTKMASGLTVDLSAAGVNVRLHLSEEVADQLHAQLATSLGKECRPRTWGEIDAVLDEVHTLPPSWSLLDTSTRFGQRVLREATQTRMEPPAGESV